MWYNGDMREFILDDDRLPLRKHPYPWSEARVAAGVSLRELEVATGINRATLSLLDRGRLVPTPEEARRILVALKMV